ncbi:alpha/beta hydrolase [Actinomyces sp. 2119]|uniref:alpha/beta hydrolase n=1 Tax=Actinomyces sp. 2119 TaxID=2321393 RepID=UPI000E6B8FA3|nr:alpha/beta hydrolase [Actinomyces sp. 2119]RJF42448.1 alpha/beta hydrolase [Actinomyces sp. 2119]
MSVMRDTAAVTTAALGIGLAHQAYATARSLRRHSGYEHHVVRCRSGNELSCYRGAPAGGSGVTMLFASGLMNTSTSWLLLASHLSGVTAVLYDRAGYGRSLRRSEAPYHLQESVADAADVVKEVCSGTGPVWLAGHSMGGYLVHRLAGQLDNIAGVILIDPMHPREMVVSQPQREGAKGTDLTLRTAPLPVALGAGLLMDKGGVLSSAAGSPFLGRLRAEISAASTWYAAAREWRYLYPHLLDGGAPLEQVATPVYVIAAEATVASSPEQGGLYDEYVASGSAGGRRLELEECDHLSIINAPQAAQRLAQQITSLVQERPEPREVTS